MPFVSEVDRRSFMDRLQPAEYEEEATFGETFGAAFSLSVDENLSISAALNNEMYARRQQQTRELIDQGLIDRDQYTDRRGRFDYDRAATDLRSRFEGLGRPGEVPDMIKMDAELRTERNEILRLRREESQDVLERGSGLAQLSGTGSALILDPLNVATFGFGATVGAAKGLTTIGRALYVARTELAIAAATETAIQPFVFAHKNDIESPYAIEDALAAIGTAATFGAGLGFVAGGLTGYFRGARERSREALVKQQFDVTPEEAARRAEVRAELEQDLNQTLSEAGVARPERVVATDEELFDEVSVAFDQVKREIRDLSEARDDFLDDLSVRRDAGEITQDQFEEIARTAEPVVAYRNARNLREKLDRLLTDIAVNKTGDVEDLKTAYDALQKSEDIIEANKESRRKSLDEIYDTEYQRFLDGETASVEELRDKNIARLEKQIKALERKDRPLTAWVVENGGLNKATWGSEFGLEAAEMTKEAGWSGRFWRAGNKGMTPDDLVERLTSDPSLAFDFQYNQFGPQTKTQADAFAWFEPLMSDKTISLYPELRAQIDDARRAIQDLQESPVDALEKLYRDAEVRVIEGNLETLAELNRTLDRMNQPTRVPEDYEPSPMEIQLEETNIEIRSTERQALNDQGLSEAHDVVMAEYRKLTPEERAITVEGEELSVDRLIEGYERDLNALDELLRCTRSA
jgi:hypothetical protein